MGDASKNIVQSILGKLWHTAEERAHSGAPQQHQTPNLVTFETRLNAILKSHAGQDLKDQVFLMDLTKVKNRIGAKWSDAHSKIHHKISTILGAQLTKRDIFIQRDDASYLLVLDGLPSVQGHLKANMLNETIVQALVGNDDPQSLTDIKDVVVDKNGVVSFVASPGKDQLIAEIVSKADLDRSTESDGSYEKPSDLEDVNFIFRPMLVTRTRVVSTFICIPVRRDTHGNYESSYRILGRAPEPNEIAELDHYTLHVAASELGKMIKMHQRSLLALPVHFETLASVQRRMKYLSNLEDIIEANTNRIVFEMVGLPDNIPQPRIIELTGALRSHSRAIIARFAPDHGNFPAYRTAGLHAVGIDVFNANTPEKALIKDMDVFVDNARQNQLRTYAHGVRSISLLTAAICSGFDYLDGYALSSVATGALDVQGFSLAQPYLDYQKTLKP